MRNISQRDLADVAVPIPPTGQDRALGELAGYHLDGVTRLGIAAKSAERRGEHLRRSLLAAAFSGKLVAQDPADEPASELLARIEAERASLATSKSKPVRRARTTATVATPPKTTTTVPAGIQEELPL